MVWIHGGGFWFGSGNSEYFFPKQLLEEDVIVVTMNYRLGALGFLCLPEEKIYGNAGLKDQRLALQWIHDNISKFKGNPLNVTIFGESAGAASVHLHVYANHAQKLFHKAIMMSGTANMEWVFQINPGFKVRKLAELLGCTAKSSTETLKFLQSDQVTPLMLLANTAAVQSPDERRRCLPLPFKPVIESELSPDIFVDKPILESLQQSNVIRFPVIMGYNSAEGIAMVVNAIRKLEIVEKDLARCIPRNLNIGENKSEIKALTQQIRDFYFAGQPLSLKFLNELTSLLSDYHFTYDMQLAVEHHSRYQQQSPLYFYNFNYVGGLNMYKKIFQMDSLRGACHGDELFYLFQRFFDDMQPNRSDHIFIKRLCKLWANFSKYGNPTPPETDASIIDFRWEPVTKLTQNQTPFTLNYLEIDTNSKMLLNPDIDRIEFWRSIYKTYNATDYSKQSSKL